MRPTNVRVLTDAFATTWTIAVEMELDSVSTFFDILEGRSKNPDFGEAMNGYTELVSAGKREIFNMTSICGSRIPEPGARSDV